MTVRLLIAGAGGFAREVAWLVDDINRTHPTWELVGFLDRESGASLRGLPVVGIDGVGGLGADAAITAVGDARLRRRLVAEVETLGLPFPTLVHPSVHADVSLQLGAGTVVCAGNLLTVDISVGAHVVVNLDCSIGHDTVIEDFVTLSPGCHLSGRTSIGRGAFLGTGVVTVEGKTIGREAIVGAGAVVVKDIPEGVTAVGVPAVPLGAPMDP
ncbi:MAG TPA: acetyltransferase [Actinomycetota bacterium]|nr:acetyltransferase [Actinomycetota bacterium]